MRVWTILNCTDVFACLRKPVNNIVIGFSINFYRSIFNAHLCFLSKLILKRNLPRRRQLFSIISLKQIWRRPDGMHNHRIVLINHYCHTVSQFITFITYCICIDNRISGCCIFVIFTNKELNPEIITIYTVTQMKCCRFRENTLIFQLSYIEASKRNSSSVLGKNNSYTYFRLVFPFIAKVENIFIPYIAMCGP